MGYLSGWRRTEIEREISYCFIEEGEQKRERSPPQSKTDRFLLIDTHIVGTTLNKEATRGPRITSFNSHFSIVAKVRDVEILQRKLGTRVEITTQTAIFQELFLLPWKKVRVG